MPKVSVIIPNYNHAKFLEKRINSVLNQTFKDLEIIILDDCSQDGSKDIIERYRHFPKVKYIIYNVKNSGSTFKQWDKGINLATGEWIWLAESDDYCEIELLETLVSKAETSENVVLSYCQSVQVDKDDNFIRTMYFHTDPVSNIHWLKDYHNTGADENSNYLVYRNTIPNASAVIFKREVYKVVSKAFTTMKLCGDWYLWINLLKLGDICFVSKPLNYFRTHPASTRNDDNSYKIRSRLKEELTIITYLSRNNIVTEKVLDIRIREILTRYANTIKKLELIKFLLKPEGEIGRILKLGVLKIKLNSMLYKAGLTSYSRNL